MGTGIPAVIVRGILEGGKTTFIKDALLNGDFGEVGKTLILVQEEGEVEYEPDELKMYKAVAEVVEKECWNSNYIYNIIRKYKPGFVIIEKNEMWGEEGEFFPDYFELNQTIAIADGQTFATYINNMRQRFVDIIKGSDLFILNRCEPKPEVSQMKRNIKLINQSIYVLALDEFGNQLRLVTDLPYDVSGDVIKLEPSDFGDFYVDTFESKDRYSGKTVDMVCKAALAKGLPPNTFVAGREAMTCCAEDIQFIGHLCAYQSGKVKNKSWIHLVAKIHYLTIDGIPEEQILLEAITVETIAPPPDGDQVINLT